MSIAKKNHLAEMRGEWIARDQTDSTNLCSDYVELFLRDSPAPGIGWEAGVLAPLLETVGTEDVNLVAERYEGGRDAQRAFFGILSWKDKDEIKSGNLPHNRRDSCDEDGVCYVQ